MEYIAHIRESDQQIQTVREHLLEVKELAESFGEKIGIPHITGLAGLLHDMGKYTNEFKEYILEAVNNPSPSSPKRGSVDHSTAGGKLLYEFFHSPKKNSRYHIILSEIVGNAIISHHSYLQDFLGPNLESNYLRRVENKELKEYEQTKQYFFNEVISERNFYEYVDLAATELETFIKKAPLPQLENNLMFLTKFIFSTLIDGDRTNTRQFEENKYEDPNTPYPQLFNRYYEKLMEKINSFSNDNATPINLLRRQMSEQCERFADEPSGIYTLSIPTGGGKTLASLRYALKHAILHHKKRIIYVVPFTTIIEQNAEEIRKILADDANILEHHSNVIDDSDDNDENQDGYTDIQQKLKLAKDNWDSPIIFTTMVQFLNAFYAKGSRNARRLHNLSEAVIVFDEVQKVPIKCVSLFNLALNFLKNYGKVSAVLCTATQPALDFVEQKLLMDPDGEMIENLDEVIQAFKRVELIDKATGETFDNEKLTAFIKQRTEKVQSVLVILNTKSVVKELYTRLLDEEMDVPVYHLSTSMCAAHRNEILDKVRHELKNGNKCICVSTQLIEAGVDVSFECVIRSLAGLDSIAQAAGRCNRHGEKPMQSVYVIDHEEENLSHLKEIRDGKHVAKGILIDLKHNPEKWGGSVLSKKAMNRYFQEYYQQLESDLHYYIPKLRKNMTELLTVSRGQNEYRNAYKFKHEREIPLFLVNSYKTAAEQFQVIDHLTTSVIVPFGEGEDIIAELNSFGSIENLGNLLKKAQKYTVNLYSYERDQLIKNDGLASLWDGKILVLKEGAYNKEYGVDIQRESNLGFNLF
ncbi:CRISPR-associated helicase Cas3' [Bacillus massiliglaciei]|uniref:CRISPR-associated helicase Cas3' n=1 Tax=Bacillus massiliglaciei TaxID=1816693 RepID=UPI000DA639BA|nr:CRISPR-associated helicase Cas3' [Bacillus massiliglaciei]